LHVEKSVINYVSKHQLSHAVNTSHITPTTHVNYGHMLLKLIGGDIVCVLSGSRTYLRSRPRLVALNQALPLGSYITCITR